MNFFFCSQVFCKFLNKQISLLIDKIITLLANKFEKNYHNTLKMVNVIFFTTAKIPVLPNKSLF